MWPPFRCPAGVKSVVVPESVTSLDSVCFPSRDSHYLEDVTFAPGSKLKRIDLGTFESCPSLKSICLPASLEYLPEGFVVFAVYSQVEKITFEAGSKLREIEDFAFCGCRSLKSICLPASVELITGASFRAGGLTTIEISPDNPFLEVRGDFIVSLNGLRIVAYFGLASDVEIEDTVEVLGIKSFASAETLRTVL
jgi:hypothetical protein